MAAAAVVAVAVAAAGLTLREPDAPVQELTAAAATDPTSATRDAGGVEAASEVVRRAIDPTVPIEERAASFERHPSDDPTIEQLLASFDGLAERAGADLRDVAVSVRLVGTSSVVADVRVEMDGNFGTRSTLRSLVVRRVGDDWLLSRESLCGLASAASAVGSTTRCSSETTVRYGSGSVDPAAMLAPGSGEAVDLTAAMHLGYWTEQTAEVDGSLWFVEYPEANAGGGDGPVGPADLVRIHLDSRAETARVRVSGGITAMSAGDGVLWVLHSVYDAAGGPTRTTLARIDADAARLTGELPMAPDALALVAADDAVWVHAAGRLDRFRGETPAPAGSVDTGMLMDPDVAAVVGHELWVRRPDGPVLAIDRRDLATRAVVVPPGRLVGSADQVWSVDDSDGGSVARLLTDDGSVLRTVDIDGARDGPLWSDGAGGLWSIGSALASSTRSGIDPGVVMDIVARPFAVHVTADGEVARTWWAEGGSATGAWFTPAGNRLGLTDGAGLRLLPVT